MARWESSCDVAGTCPECGLHFDWADLLREDRARLPGFIEHPGHGGAWTGFAFLSRALRTWTWALWPPRFFARVCMHHRFDILRLLLWLPVLCGAMYLAAAACMFVGTFVQAGAAMGPALAAERAAMATINDLCVGLVHVTPRWTVLVRLSSHRAPIWLFPGLAAWAVAPLLLLALSDTRRLMKIRAAHVFRAAVYGCAWIVPIFALRLVNRAGMVVLVSLDRWVGTPRTLVVELTGSACSCPPGATSSVAWWRWMTGGGTWRSRVGGAAASAGRVRWCSGSASPRVLWCSFSIVAWSDSLFEWPSPPEVWWLSETESEDEPTGSHANTVFIRNLNEVFFPNRVWSVDFRKDPQRCNLGIDRPLTIEDTDPLPMVRRDRVSARHAERSGRQIGRGFGRLCVRLGWTRNGCTSQSVGHGA